MSLHITRQRLLVFFRGLKPVLLALFVIFDVIGMAAVAGPIAASPIRIKVFVGLTGGGDYLYYNYNAIAAKWNDQHQDIKMSFDFHFYPGNGQRLAQYELQRQLAGKEPPDIIGPVGVAVANMLPPRTWMDLSPRLASDPLNKDDFSDFGISQFKAVDGKILALGAGLYPSLLFVNEDAFKNAGVPLPPKALGASYIDRNGASKPWDWDTLAEVAQQVTVDKAGKHPGEKGFNSGAISMYGYANFWNRFRDTVASFGPQDAGLGADGKTATFGQEAVQQAVQWYQDGIFKNHFIPSRSQQNQLQGTTSPFESGKIAMWYSHVWYLGSMGTPKFNWGFYAPPAVSGTEGKTVISPMHADGFGIADKSRNKDAAWQVLKWLVSDPDVAAHLCKMWNCIPNALSARGSWVALRPDNWRALLPSRMKFLTDLIAHADTPQNESYLPNYTRVTDILEAFWNNAQTAQLDKVENSLTTLNKQIQALFNAELGNQK